MTAATPATSAAPPVAATDAPSPHSDPARAWMRLVVVTTVVTAAADIMAMVLQRSIIPPVLIGALLSLASLAVLRWRATVGLVTIGVISVLLIATGAPFAAPPLAHPDSPIGFTHSASYLIGRSFLLVAVVGARTSRSRRSARVVMVAAALTATAIIATTARSTSTRVTANPADGDIRVVAEGFDFPDDAAAPAGATLFVENRDTVWHRLMIPGTEIGIDLAANTGVRVPVDLPPGDYVLFCDITGHDGMVGHLTVTR